MNIRRLLACVLVLAEFLFPCAAHARSSDDALIMGVFPRRNFTVTIKMYSPMVDYLTRTLGRRVRLETTHNFQTFWHGVVNRRYDLVHYNQFHYVKSHKEFGYQVILKNEEFYKSTISGSIVVRKDSGYHSLAELKGKKIIFGGGKKAMISYVVATYLLRQAGLDEGDYEEEFALNPPNACIATYFGLAEAGGIGNVVPRLPVVQDRIDSSQIKFLAVSQPLPHLPWAVKGSMDPALRGRLRAALIQLNHNEDGRKILEQARLTGMAPAVDEEYNIHRNIIFEVTGKRF